MDQCTYEVTNKYDLTDPQPYEEGLKHFAECRYGRLQQVSNTQEQQAQRIVEQRLLVILLLWTPSRILAKIAIGKTPVGTYGEECASAPGLDTSAMQEPNNFSGRNQPLHLYFVATDFCLLTSVACAAVHQAAAIRSSPRSDELANVIHGFRTMPVRFGVRRNILLEDEVLRIVHIIGWPGRRIDCN